MNNLQQKLIERYVEKKYHSKNFTYRDYLDLRKKLVAKNIDDAQEIEKTSAKAREVRQRPDIRIMDPQIADQITVFSVGGGLAAGIATSMLVGEPSSASTYAGAILGLIGGGLASLGNIVAYEDKPITNIINKTIVKAHDRKVRRLSNRQELRDYTLYCFRQQEREHTPSYEDFVRAVEETDNILNP